MPGLSTEGGDIVTVKMEGKTMCGEEGRFGSDNEFYTVFVHPGFDIRQAVVNDGVDRFGCRRIVGLSLA